MLNFGFMFGCQSYIFEIITLGISFFAFLLSAFSIYRQESTKVEIIICDGGAVDVYRVFIGDKEADLCALPTIPQDAIPNCSIKAIAVSIINYSQKDLSFYNLTLTDSKQKHILDFFTEPCIKNYALYTWGSYSPNDMKRYLVLRGNVPVVYEWLPPEYEYGYLKANSHTKLVILFDAGPLSGSDTGLIGFNIPKKNIFGSEKVISTPFKINPQSFM